METAVKTAQPVYQVPAPATAKAESKEVVYTAGPGDPLVDWHRHHFVSGVPTMVHSEHILALVDGNPSFSFKGQDKARELADKQEAAAKQADAERVALMKSEADEMTARHQREVDAMTARHKAEAGRIAARTKASVPAAPTNENLSTGKPKSVAEVDAERSAAANASNNLANN